MAGMAVFLFDMDGLLLDTEREHWVAFQETMDRLGIASGQDYPFFLSLVGASGKETRNRLTDYLTGHVTMEVFLAVWDEIADARAEADVPVKPFVRESLARLSQDGHRMAVVTSTQRARAETKLDKAGLLNAFELVTGGDDVSANKPDPAPYVETATRLGVAPETCFAFEDSDRGIEAAVRAGCLSTQIPDMRPEGLALPDLGQRVAADLNAALSQLGF